jgi:hypothetical protein
MCTFVLVKQATEHLRHDTSAHARACATRSTTSTSSTGARAPSSCRHESPERQYLHFSTGKTSKVSSKLCSTCRQESAEEEAGSAAREAAAAAEASKVMSASGAESVCGVSAASDVAVRCESVRVLCTSKARKLSGKLSSKTDKHLRGCGRAAATGARAVQCWREQRGTLGVQQRRRQRGGAAAAAGAARRRARALLRVSALTQFTTQFTCFTCFRVQPKKQKHRQRRVHKLTRSLHRCACIVLLKRVKQVKQAQAHPQSPPCSGPCPAQGCLQTLQL